ncbi:MAG TPA: penicillin-binding protein 2 [Kineosporiaceae bacterium]|nr:penicillin-binding protein 2 [Kineosporiaceae bacterium]
MVVFTVFGARLFQLQGVDAEALARQALKDRSRTVTLPAQRGDILDANRAALATSVERRDITVDQTVVVGYNQKSTKLPAAQKGVPGAALALAPILSMSYDQVVKKLTGKKPFVYLKKKVEPAVWNEVESLAIPGLYSVRVSKRTYPNNNVAASMIGFLDADGIPLSGIEKSRNDILQGADGTYTYERGAKGQQIATGLTSEKYPVPGRDIQLTIDRDLQWQALDALSKQVEATKAKSGAVVIMDTRTGDVLALADAPTFDANSPSSAPRADRENRALIDVFEPGSTSKVITAAAAMEEGKGGPGTKLTVPGTLERGGKLFHDSHAHGTEKLTLTGVLAESSNIGTIKIGERLSRTVLHDYLTKFGYGSRTGVGLPESPGILTPVKDYSNTTPYTVMFGQGVAVTALQAANVFATVANDGVRNTPRVIKAIGDADGVLHEQAAGPTTRVISAKTAQKLRLMLESVVSGEGTGGAASIPGYRVAGKTGTADYYDETVGKYNGYTASFIGIAPADKPRLVVAVILQQPVNGHYGGTVAAPVFQELMKKALAQVGAAPSGAKAPTVPLTWR